MRIQFLKDVELTTEEKRDITGSKLFRKDQIIEILGVVPCSENFSHIVIDENITLPDVINHEFKILIS